jgi:sugar O-acyltransferase (sialic acid O-acetyltransferase NeuD family)
MKDIVICGAGGMGREALWLIKSINAQEPTWRVLGFIDDNEALWGKEINGLKILGGDDWLSNYNGQIYVTCAIGKSAIRKVVYEKVSRFANVKLATLIDPSVRVDRTVSIGEGSIICYQCIVTIDIRIGKGVLMNTGASVGHDAIVGDYCIFHTKSMAAGNTKFGECCEIGSGAFVLQGKKIADNTVIAPLSSVLLDINETGIYAGNPARRMK